MYTKTAFIQLTSTTKNISVDDLSTSSPTHWALQTISNANVAYSATTTLDTFAVYYKDLDKLDLIADRSMGWYMQIMRLTTIILSSKRTQQIISFQVTGLSFTITTQ